MTEEVLRYIWTDFERDFKKISEHVEDKCFDAVVAIPRGGLVLGTCLSHELKIPLEVYSKRQTPEHTNRVLLVDEISDSGQTLRRIAREFNDPYVVTLHEKEGTLYVPDFSVECLDKNLWITYPWEETR